MEWVAGLEKSEQKIDKYLDQYEKGLWDQRDRDAFNKVKVPGLNTVRLTMNTRSYY